MVTSHPNNHWPVAERRDTYLIGQVFSVTLLLVFCAQAVNLWGVDLIVARWFFDARTNVFPHHASRTLEILGHRLVLVAPVGVAIAAAGAAVASRWLPALRPWRGVLWATALTCALGQVVIAQLKHYTALPRPYDLSMFGGYAPYPDRFWAVSRRDAGGALPSGHAGAGYALLSLYFAGWAAGRPAWRWTGLAIGLAAGIGFSLVRIAQGAHFLSQTLWSAAVMWFIASLLFYPLLVRSGSRPARQGGKAGAYMARAGAANGAP
ncbi:acid phosphatase [Bordetella genomosp. 10]|uniref:Acid phosphatase n=1 Tax=Bordetella genomosp. 10 TaxID=1416804 RepID=A0A261SIN6_9BORD|nr:phosphatase PAP2 family protein [Bordetella genomosp. 10]OZI37298.1 acid phosphatase [Bordetella genomosp. 10]